MVILMLMENDCRSLESGFKKSCPLYLYHCVTEAQICDSGAVACHCVRQESDQPALLSLCLPQDEATFTETLTVPASPSLLLPPVFVRLVLLASVGVSRGLLRESGGSDSMCGC